MKFIFQEMMMSEIKCGECKLRKKYDEKPKSLLGRFWRWHANWCPSWKAYMQSLPNDERVKVAESYNMKKYLS